MPGNDGRTLVLVPDGADEQPPGRSPAHGTLIETLREAVALLGEQLQAERSRADSARAELEAGRARADTDRTEIARITGEMAEIRASEAVQRVRADKAERTVREAEQATRIAEDALNVARQADEARRARGRWARLMAAWRGE
jgi:hypothetical protein